MLFSEPERSTGFQPVKRKGRAMEVSREEREATGKMPVPQAITLDRVHMAMLLQAGGQATALRASKVAAAEGPPILIAGGFHMSAGLRPQQEPQTQPAGLRQPVCLDASSPCPACSARLIHLR